MDTIGELLQRGADDAVAIGAAATTAPLSRGLTADEFEFNLSDLRAKALVIEAGLESPARAVAAKLHIPVVELVAHREHGAGTFTIRNLVKNGVGPFQAGFAEAADV